MRILLTVFFLFSNFVLLSNIQAQTFAIGNSSIGPLDPARSNRTVSTEVYYPATTAGVNSPVDSNWPGFPVIILGHGFLMGEDAYYYIRDYFVPRGYIVAMPTTEGGFPDHLEFGKDLAFLADYFTAENSDPNSIFHCKLNGKIAIGGHSMGGGASFLGAPLSGNIDALFNMAAAETDPSAIAAAANVTVPTLVLAGTDDCVTSPATDQEPMFNATAAACKLFVNITGGGHCNFGDSNLVCGFGEFCTPALSRADQHLIVLRYLEYWFGTYLMGDADVWDAMTAALPGDADIVYDLQCAAFDPCVCLTTSNPSYNVYCDPVQVQSKAILSGVYDGNGNMRTDLNSFIPLAQPYSGAPYNYNGTETVSSVPANMVDWVLLEMRSAELDLTSSSRQSVTIERKAGLLLDNGDIVAMDGISPVTFDSLHNEVRYNICIRHRNHLDIVSEFCMEAGPSIGYDFTSGVGQAFGGAQQFLSSDGKAMMFGADYNANGNIQNTDYDAWKVNSAVLNVYDILDGNLDGVIQTTDYDVWKINPAILGTNELDY